MSPADTVLETISTTEKEITHIPTVVCDKRSRVRIDNKIVFFKTIIKYIYILTFPLYFSILNIYNRARLISRAYIHMSVVRVYNGTEKERKDVEEKEKRKNEKNERTKFHFEK